MDSRSARLSILRVLGSGSIRRRLTLGVSSVIAAVVLVFVASVLVRQGEFLNRRSEERGKALALTLAANSRSWVLASDVQGLGEVLQSIRGYPDLAYAMVVTPAGQVLAHTDDTRVGLYLSDPVSLSLREAEGQPATLSRARGAMDFAAPVNAGGHTLAWVRVGIRDEELRQNLASILREGILYSLLAVGLGALFATLFARGITRGLDQLVEFTRKVGRGQDGVRVSLDREDELGELGRAFNAMGVELQRSARELGDSRSHLLQLLENLPVAVAVYGVDGSLGYANPMARDFLGLDCKPPQGPGPSPRFLNEDGSPMGSEHHPVDRVLRERRPLKGLVIGLRGSTETPTRWAFVNAFPESDDQGALNRVIVCFVDITERLRAEEDNRRLAADVEHAHRLESLGNLAGGVAHDMNNILAAILSLASLHKGSAPADSPLGKAFRIIESAGLRGRDLVKHLLDFARKGLEGARVMDLNALVREETDLLSRTTLKRADWTLDLEEPANPVKGDPAGIGNAIINLCVNAVDAMERGGRITLRTRNLPDGGCLLEVQDTGQGMPAEVLARALDPFYTTKPQGKGTGLGLSIVYGTMKAHGGSVEIRSLEGVGTTVRLLFPPATPAGRAPVSAAEGPAAVHAKAAPLRILLVDDDDWVRDATTPMLQMLGHKVLAVDGGLAALESIHAGFSPDLVILDQNMPSLSGTETLLRILKDRPGQRALLASGGGEPDLHAIPPGSCVRFIPKPFTLEELCAALEP